MKHKTPFTLLLVVFALVCLRGTSQATIWYVSQLGNNTTGMTWTGAWNSPATAIAGASAGDEIWVQRGNYVGTPLVIPNFGVPNQGLKIYGGFHGWETSRSFRNYITNPTVIDASLGGPVVTFLPGCTAPNYVIDGFVIKNGFNPSGTGGGVRLINAGATVANCTIVSNQAGSGGGIGIIGTMPSIIEYNKISENQASVAGGGTGQGGGIYSPGGASIIRNNWIGPVVCVGGGNLSDGDGGGIYIMGGNPYIVHNVVLRNQALRSSSNGGGIFVGSCTNLCTIGNNHVQENHAGNGAGIWVSGGDPWLAGNTVIWNVLDTPTGIGGGIGLFSVTTARIANCIVANNANFQIQAVPPFPLQVINWNCVYEPSLTMLYSGVVPGALDLRVDPLLDPPCDLATVQHLGAGSPCINAGNTAWAVGPGDIDGQARIDPSGIVDIGADEYYAPGRTLVAGALIQSTIDLAGPGDIVQVPFGVYAENLVMKPCVTLQGTGMPVINGSNSNTVITVPPGVKCWIDGFEINFGHAIQGGGINLGCSAETYVKNCTIRDCFAEMDQSLFPSDPIGVGAGGGLYWAMYSTGLLQDCDVRTNFAQGPLVNSIYAPMWASVYGMGAGVALESGASPLILTNRIRNNAASWDGGGVWTFGNSGTPRIELNHIVGNSAINGGGVYVRLTSNPTLCNNVVCQNQASANGGGLTLYGGGRGTYRSNTFAYNTAPPGGISQVHVWGGSAMDDFVNNIVLGSTPIAAGIPAWSLAPPQRHNNCFWPDAWLPDIWADPLITSDCTAQLRTSGSPCWNTGFSLKQCSTVDIDGNPRIVWGDIDIGADELQASGTGVEQPVTGPERIELQPAMPNPFTSGTMLRYGLLAAGHVRLSVHDVQGRSIATLVDGVQAAGWHSVAWDGRMGDGGRAAAGIYFAHLATGDQVLERTLVRIR